MTLADAQVAVLAGAKFGNVYPLLEGEGDRIDLKEWFCRDPAVPVNPLRPSSVPAVETTGQVCGNCQGSRLVRTGTCVTCLDCGDNAGCG